MSRIRIRILNDGHRLQATWEQAVGASRAATRRSAESNLELMEHLLLQGAEVGSTLAALYRNASSRWPVDITQVCGGCPADRFNPERPHSYRVPLAVALADVERSDMTAWRALFPWLDPSFVLVFHDDMQRDRAAGILKLLTWLVSACGVQEVATESGSRLAQMSEVRTLYRRSRRRILLHRELSQTSEEPYSPLSRVSILETKDPSVLEGVQMLQRPYHIVILPASTQDPENPQRLLVDTVTCGTRLETLISVLTA
jgi:hypothetical protein